MVIRLTQSPMGTSGIMEVPLKIRLDGRACKYELIACINKVYLPIYLKGHFRHATDHDDYFVFRKMLLVMSKQATVDDNPAGIRWIKG